MRGTTIAIGSAVLAVFLAMPLDAADKDRKIVFLAGTKSHGLAGNGIHEYEGGLRLFQQCLDSSPNVQGVKTELHTDGWPKDPATLDDADTIVIFSDGLSNERTKLQQHPFLRGENLKVIDKQMKRGCGLVVIHWPLWVTADHGGPEFIDWLGGYCHCGGKEEGIGREFPDGRWEGSPKHPINSGVTEWKVSDEYYGNIRFKTGDERLVPIIPMKKPAQRLWAWACERADGGRAFAFIGGHAHRNWANDNLRRVMLNAILWTAKAEVPAGGVESKWIEPAKPKPADKKKAAKTDD